MDEFKLIDAIKQKTYRQPSLIKGVGDDAAVFRKINKDIVTAVDTFVENVHFTKQTLSFKQIGYRALAANISDLAAMGASPLFYLVSIVIPKGVSDQSLVEIFTGMKELAMQYNMDLIGGDTVSGQQLVLSVTVIGEVAKNKARYRSDAKNNDVVFVTGTLGDARAGLEILLGRANVERQKRLIQKHQMPTPRVTFVQTLEKLRRLALNDISDGVANELHEIAASSGVTIEIDAMKIPISDELKQFSQKEQTEWKLFGGEDFELVGTVAKTDFSFVENVGKKLGVKVTEIGNVSYNRQRQGEVFIYQNGKWEKLKKHGYIHRN